MLLVERNALDAALANLLAARLTEPVDGPVRHEVVESGAMLLTEPTSTAVAVDSVAAGAEVPVLGAFGEFLAGGFVKLEDLDREFFFWLRLQAQFNGVPLP